MSRLGGSIIMVVNRQLCDGTRDVSTRKYDKYKNMVTGVKVTIASSKISM